MSKLIAVLAVVSLLFVGSMARADLALTIVANDGGTTAADWKASFSGSELQFNVIATGVTAGTNGVAIDGMGLGVILSGTTSMVSSPAALPADMTGFLWAASPLAATAAEMTPNLPAGIPLTEAYSSVLDMGKSFTPSNGTVIAHFGFTWTGVLPPDGGLIITVTDDSIDAGSNAYMMANDGGYTSYDVSTTNNGLHVPVPEPATMSLLGIGLASLLLRKKK